MDDNKNYKYIFIILLKNIKYPKTNQMHLHKNHIIMQYKF